MSVMHRSLNDLRYLLYPGRSENQIRNAFHEAGHALVCLGFGVELSTVTITPGPGYDGQVRMLADSRGFGSVEQRLTIYAAGRAGEEIGPFLRDDAWTKDTRYRSDLNTIEELLPGCSEQDVRRAVDMAKECIRAWPYTFDNIAEELLSRGVIDWPGVLNCVAGHEYALPTHWQRYAVVDAPTPAPVVETIGKPATPPVVAPAARRTVPRAEAIQVLEAIRADLQHDRFVPAHIRRLVSQLESTTPTRGRVHGLEYGAPVMLETR